MRDLTEKVEDILSNAEKYHQAYYNAEPFRGPSLYFHQRAINTRLSQDFTTHLEYVYAALASWGMHRMGRRGAKMVPFRDFHQSIERLKGDIKAAQEIDPRGVRQDHWNLLNTIFKGIRIMASGVSLVGNSKVMHHMIPNIVPPIDREYTLRFVYGNKNVKPGIETEWKMMKTIISDVFIPIAVKVSFSQQSTTWIANQNDYPWDTSTFKVIDNLIIAVVDQARDLGTYVSY